MILFQKHFFLNKKWFQRRFKNTIFLFYNVLIVRSYVELNKHFSLSNKFSKFAQNFLDNPIPVHCTMSAEAFHKLFNVEVPRRRQEEEKEVKDQKTQNMWSVSVWRP